MASPKLNDDHAQLIAREVGCKMGQIRAAAELLDEGATVPFIARYRKEATDGLEDAQLEIIADKRAYFSDLVARQEAILASVEEQGKLTGKLAAEIRATTTKQALEDLYLPFKRKRRTKAQVARERGLEPLTGALINRRRDRHADPRALARPFVNPGKEVPDVDAALEGAGHIVAERVNEDPDIRSALRGIVQREGMLVVKVAKGKQDEGQNYRDYFDHKEPGRLIKAHRLLAILRGEREGFLKVDLAVDDDRQVEGIARHIDVPHTPCGEQLRLAVRDGYKRLLKPSIANEVRGQLKDKAEDEAISVFRANLDALLLQSPLGQVAVMGLDPGYRTGCKLAVVDGTGKVLDTSVIYPVPPKSDVQGATRTVERLLRRYRVQAVAIGNGTASRETEQFARGAVKEAGLGNEVTVVIVPETGASVYSASALARQELPDMDVSLRGAVSIARRLQDPLAELVKIEPASLGVGQYQHDVNARRLAEELDRTVESAVNRVGVELNSASPALLRRVSGLSERMANNIVSTRDSGAPYATRRQVLKVAGVGPKSFEQAAGFLRIRGAKNPLDATGVHPERYKLVEAMARRLGVSVASLVGDPAQVARLDFAQFIDESQGVGRYTLDDIRAELERPGRDPRPRFEAPTWRDDITSIDDLETDMVLEGRVSNVANFGAFVDIGVKRDGMVHLSQLSDHWVEDPREVVKVGQIVKVRVMDVDRERGRISLSMKGL